MPETSKVKKKIGAAVQIICKLEVGHVTDPHGAVPTLGVSVCVSQAEIFKSGIASTLPEVHVFPVGPSKED